MRLYKRFTLRRFTLRDKPPLEITLYLFQEGRWELGLTYDINGDPLFAINFIFIHLEFTFIKE